MKKIIHVFLYAGLLALALFGCKPSNNSNQLVVNISSDPGSLDPNLASGSWEHWLFVNIFEGLVAYNKEGNVVPAVAKDFKVSNNGTTYTFTLVDNAKWSDGTPVTAHDFEYSWKRTLNPETAASYASMLYIIKGGEAYNSGKGSADDVQVKALDDKTLQVNLTLPAVYFVEMLEHPVFLPIPKHVVEKHGKEWIKLNNIVFNGAYKLTDWKPQSHLMATKNTNYRNAQNVSIENIKFVTINQADASLEAFRSKEVDVSYDFPADKMDVVKRELDGEWYIDPLTAVYFYAINIKNPKNAALKNKEIRHALSMTIDRDFVVQNVSGSGEVPAYGLVPESLYNSSLPVNKQPKPYWYGLSMQEKIAKAKEIMAKNGFSKEKPMEVHLSYNTLDSHKRLAVAVSKMWQEIGVKVVLDTADVNVHFDNLKAGNFEIGRAGWIADYEEPSTMLYVLESDSGNNYSKYNNAEFDRLVKLGKATLNETTRFNAYAQAEQLALNDMPVIPMYFYVNRMLVSKKVQGFKSYLGAVYLFQHYSIAK